MAPQKIKVRIVPVDGGRFALRLPGGELHKEKPARSDEMKVKTFVTSGTAARFAIMSGYEVEKLIVGLWRFSDKHTSGPVWCLMETSPNPRYVNPAGELFSAGKETVQTFPRTAEGLEQARQFTYKHGINLQVSATVRSDVAQQVVQA